MDKKTISKKRKAYILGMRCMMWLSVGITVALVLFLLGYVLAKGLPNITWELLSTKPSQLRGTIGILPDILNTLYIILVTLVIVLPVGVGAAIYLNEYAKNKKLVGIIEYAAETLSGIPSIIYGLVGMLLFANTLGSSLLAGALTLVDNARKKSDDLHPKGIQEKTTELILEYLKENSGRSFTGDEIAEQVGLTGVTVRRYMNFLAESGRVIGEMNYETGGRPCMKYRIS